MILLIESMVLIVGFTVRLVACTLMVALRIVVSVIKISAVLVKWAIWSLNKIMQEVRLEESLAYARARSAKPHDNNPRQHLGHHQ